MSKGADATLNGRISKLFPDPSSFMIKASLVAPGSVTPSRRPVVEPTTWFALFRLVNPYNVSSAENFSVTGKRVKGRVKGVVRILLICKVETRVSVSLQIAAG